MTVKLLTEHHLEFLSLKGAAEARPSLHISKCHIVGNLMHWLQEFLAIRRAISLNETFVLFCLNDDWRN